MCLITVAPKGVKSLDLDTLRHSAKQNDDGWGISWYKEKTGVWKIWRSLDMDLFWRAIKEIPQDVPLVIHQRYATHGTTSIENTHPFRVTKDSGVLLFHNGVISGTRASGKAGVSDTAAFVEDELALLVEAAGSTWLKHPKGKEFLKDRVGFGNVLAIAIKGNPEVVLINEKRGDWEGDLYYSNSYSRPSKFGKFRGGYYGGFDYNSYDEWEDAYETRRGSFRASYSYGGAEETCQAWPLKAETEATATVEDKASGLLLPKTALISSVEDMAGDWDEDLGVEIFYDQEGRAYYLDPEDGEYYYIDPENEGLDPGEEDYQLYLERHSAAYAKFKRGEG